MAITNKVYKSRLQKWLDNLRSGKYSKGENVLRQVENGKCKHCVLGVAVETFNENNPKEKIQYDESLGFKGIGIGYIPAKVRKWFGLTYRSEENLIAYNDCENKTFKQIAYHMERCPHLYFEWAKDK